MNPNPQPSRAKEGFPPRSDDRPAIRPGIMAIPTELQGPIPRVAVCMAMSADGKTATADRRFSRFGSRRDAARLYRLRTEADAILCGAATVRQENAALDPGPARFRRRRRRLGRPAWPLRIAVSGSGSLRPEGRLFETGPEPPIVLVTRNAPANAIDRLATRACVAVWPGEQVDWIGCLRWLRLAWQVERLLVEGGGTLNEALFRAGAVHELHLTLCPWLLGGERAPSIADGPGVAHLAQAARLRLIRYQQVGQELFLTYEAAPLGPGGLTSPP